jgi:uncharacterized protein (DUF58 family)
MKASGVSLEDPEIFLAIDDLELAGRGIADAVWSGRHGSFRRGSGIEFHSHRAYERGDDLRMLNWTLYARHRRLFVRESRLEARRPVYLVLDATASMSIAHGPWSKFHYAARVAAAIAHLAGAQGDAAGLAFLHKDLHAALSPRTGVAQTAGICHALASVKPAGIGDPRRALAGAHYLFRQRGFVILISDFLEQEDAILGELAQLRARGHDVLALQILDPVEAELPASGDYDFLDLEDGARLRTSTEDVHREYARIVAEWRAGLRARALASGLRWESVTTADPLVPLIRHWVET